MTEKQIFEEIEKHIDETVIVNEEDESKSKINRRKLARALFVLYLVNNKKNYEIGVFFVLNQTKIKKLIKQTSINRGFTIAFKERRKVIGYGRLARRQANIFNNQLRKEGLKSAKNKLKKRSKLIIDNEKGFYQDTGQIDGANAYVKEAKGVVTKQWVHGKYRNPLEPRGSHRTANGQTQLLNDDFIVGGESVSKPRTFSNVAENVNCGCGIEVKVL